MVEIRQAEAIFRGGASLIFLGMQAASLPETMLNNLSPEAQGPELGDCEGALASTERPNQITTTSACRRTQL